MRDVVNVPFHEAVKTLSDGERADPNEWLSRPLSRVEVLI